MISVCIIYSEEDSFYLKDCINSVPPNSEICLLKTKPVKNIGMNAGALGKPRILVKNGITLKYSDWYYAENNFSFSEARNACKDMATGDWILQLDADERLIYYSGEFDNLDKMPANIGGLLVGLVSNYYPADEGHPIKKEVINCLRLFRNRVEFGYQYRAHEQILPSIKNAGFIVCDSPITIHHLGYFLSDKSKSIEKLKRNMSMIFKDLAVEPNNVYLNGRLASHYIDLVSRGIININF
jgi:glycosyltransferase involved in cell wall biosynthesis